MLPEVQVPAEGSAVTDTQTGPGLKRPRPSAEPCRATLTDGDFHLVSVVYGDSHGQGVIVLVRHGQFGSTRILQQPRFPIDLEKKKKKKKEWEKTPRQSFARAPPSAAHMHAWVTLVCGPRLGNMGRPSNGH